MSDEKDPFGQGAGPSSPPTDDPFGKIPKRGDYFAKLGPQGDALASQPSGISAILHAYGQGVADQWGSARLGLSDETISAMRELGIFNDYQKGHTTFWKTMNEALIRDAAVVGDAAWRGLAGTLYGGPKGVAEAPGVPGIAAVPAGIWTGLQEAFPEGGGLRLGPLVPRAPGLGTLDAARAARIIGPDGEAGWKGTAPAAEPLKFPIPRIGAEPMAEPPQVMPAPGPEAYTPQPSRLPLLEGVPETYNIGGTRIPADTLLKAYAAQVDARETLVAAAEKAIVEASKAAETEPPPRLPPGTIASDVTRQLVDAGRPQDQAEASAALVEAHYRARAAWFEGSKGTAEDLYGAEAPRILGPRRVAEPPGPLLTGEAPPAAPKLPEGVQMPPPLMDEIQRRIGGAESEGAPPGGKFFVDLPAGTRGPGTLPFGSREEAEAFARANYRPGSYQVREEAATELEQVRRGRITFPAERQATATIRLLGTADASTFVHETGHAWLEELMRDAADARAPTQLVADAKTARDWMGAEEGKPISRAGHEKFARGFERYMMEGKAPTPGLASVFERFKQWLTDIYQTVKRLRAPITDDIRGVMDRMLAAPEGEGRTGGSFIHYTDTGDIHEASRTPAGPGVYLTTKETTAYPRAHKITVSAPKADDESFINWGASIAGQPNRVKEFVERHLSNLEEQPTSGQDMFNTLVHIYGKQQAIDMLDKAGIIGSASGDERAIFKPENVVRAPLEPPEVPRPPLTEAPMLPTGEPKPEPAPPSQVRGVATGIQPEGRLLDKAGNIRLDNIETTEDIKQAMRDSADRNDEFLGRRRGVVSDEQRDSLATLLGTTPDKVLTKGIGEAFTDSEIKFLERTLAQSAGNLHELAVKAVESGSDQDRLAATEALLRHDMVQGLFSQATAEAGRALRAFRRSKEFWSKEATGAAKLAEQAVSDATGRTFDQMDAILKRIASFDQSGKITKFTRDALKPGLFDYIQSVWINALLSGPFTHATYTAAGQILGLFRSGVVYPSAAFARAIRRQLGSGEEGVRLGEARAAFFGQARGLQEGMRAAWDSWKTGVTVLPDEVTRTLPGGAGQPAMGRVGIIPGRVGTVLESPGRMVAALHSFNWTSFYRQSIGALAYRTAVHEGLYEAGDAFARRVAQLTQDPTEAMIKEAAADASGGALVTRPSYESILGWLSRWSNKGYQVPGTIPFTDIPMGTLRPFKYIDPFIQIQGNVMRSGLVDYTPLAAFSAEVRGNLMGRNGATAADLQRGKMIAGTIFMTASGMLWGAALLNDSGPSDPREAAAYRRRNGMQHGLKIGDLTFNMIRMGTLGLQMSVTADLAHAIYHGAVGDEDGLQVASDLVHSFAQNILDESFMRGPQELLQALDDPDRYGARYIRQFVASAVPFSVGLGQVTHEIDPYVRRARTLLDAVKAKIPGLSTQVQPLYDVWGQETPSAGWALTYYEHVARNDPVELELDRLGVYPAMPEAKIRGVTLTDQQYAEYSRISGRTAKARLDQMIGSPDWQMMPDVSKIEAIQATRRASLEFGRTLILMENQGIVETALKAKSAAAEGATPAQQRAILRTQAP